MKEIKFNPRATMCRFMVIEISQHVCCTRDNEYKDIFLLTWYPSQSKIHCELVSPSLRLVALWLSSMCSKSSSQHKFWRAATTIRLSPLCDAHFTMLQHESSPFHCSIVWLASFTMDKPNVSLAVQNFDIVLDTSFYSKKWNKKISSTYQGMVIILAFGPSSHCCYLIHIK